MSKHQKTENLKPEKSETLPAVQTPETLAQLDADLIALAAEANELIGDIRVGDDLRFKKGDWKKTITGEDEPIAIGNTMPFAVDMLSYRRCWIEWRDHKPVRKIIGRPVDGFISPMREQLGDNDKSRWPRDAKGIPQDPWQENFLMVMRDLSDDRLCTFTTTSYYGSRALGMLLKIYAHNAKKHPGSMPVVLLSSEVRATQNFGDVDAPVFTVVDWKPFGEGSAPPGMKLQPPASPKTQQVLPPPKKSIGDEMDESIPF
jgi:hypothetical protein